MDKGKRTDVVMAIYPNTLGFGFAIMENALTLIRADIMNVRPICNYKLLDKFNLLLDYYLPKVIIVEDYNGIGSLKAQRIRKAIELIKEKALERGLTVKIYSRNDIRQVFHVFKAHSKYEISKIIAQNIPQMKLRVPKKRKTSESQRYITGAFDAVSLAITHFYKTH